jgi:hypothetical protein
LWSKPPTVCTTGVLPQLENSGPSVWAGTSLLSRAVCFQAKNKCYASTLRLTAIRNCQSPEVFTISLSTQVVGCNKSLAPSFAMTAFANHDDRLMLASYATVTLMSLSCLQTRYIRVAPCFKYFI